MIQVCCTVPVLPTFFFEQFKAASCIVFGMKNKGHNIVGNNVASNCSRNTTDTQNSNNNANAHRYNIIDS